MKLRPRSALAAALLVATVHALTGAPTICAAVASASLGHTRAAGPPAHMPEDLVDAYTMKGRIPVGRFFVDDTGVGGVGTHYKYRAAHVAELLAAARRQMATARARVAAGRPVPTHGRHAARAWWPHALAEHASLLEGARVVVFGSMEPWFECLCLAAGAAHVTTVEYNRLTYEHENIDTLTVVELQAATNAGFAGSSVLGSFDVGISASSFDHDGLGRYGDPIAPDGDLAAMRTARSLLKPGAGVLFLTVPVGPDVVVWNLHRRYGTLRLPRLLEGWEEVGRVGWDERKLTADANWRQSYEPVLVLRAPAAAAQAAAEAAAEAAAGGGGGEDVGAAAIASSKEEL